MLSTLHIPDGPQAFIRRDGGLLLCRRIYTAAHLPWYRAAILELPELPQLAAVAQTWGPCDPALILVWCQSRDASLVRGALAALDPQLGRASIVSWPGTLDATGVWETWRGTPHLVPATVAPARYGAAEVLR